VIACGMPLRRAARITLVLTLLAVPASAHAQVIRPSSVIAGTAVPAGGSRALTLNCPGSSVALNAAVIRQGAGAIVRRSVPGGGAADWTFRLGAEPGARRRGVRAVLRCVRLKVPSGVSGARLAVKTRTRMVGTIAPGASASRRVGCGPAWIATGYGATHGRGGDVRVTAAVPSTSGWSLRLENTGSRAALTHIAVRCLRREVAANRNGGATTLRFGVVRRSVVNEVPAGQRNVRSSCRQRQFSLATGVSFDWRDDIVMLGGRPSGARGGLWSFRQSGGPQTVRSTLVCLGLGARFR
jgi:hypothetical protein